MRDQQAKFWRQGRAAFFAASPEVQLKIAIYWASSAGNFMPATALNFIYAVNKYTKPYHIADSKKPSVREREKWIDALKQAKRYSNAA